MTTQPQIWSTFSVQDARAEIDFLVRAFGFRELVAYADDAGVVQHAELAGPEGGGVMLGTVRPRSDKGCVARQISAYVVVSDPDALFARAKAAGAEVVNEPYDTDYGSRDCAFNDPEGNTWFFGTYAGHPLSETRG
jgi:uncharacterized glyoxalase superfamily protein PhnB